MEEQVKEQVKDTCIIRWRSRWGRSWRRISGGAGGRADEKPGEGAVVKADVVEGGGVGEEKQGGDRVGRQFLDDINIKTKKVLVKKRDGEEENDKRRLAK